MLKLQVKQVRDMKPGDSINIKEGKTGKQNILVINKTVHKVLSQYLTESNFLMRIISSRAGKGIAPYRFRRSTLL